MADAPQRRRFGKTEGVLISSDVLELAYRHDGSADPEKEWQHDMGGTGVLMYGCADGSIRLCHPSEPLWEYFDVEDDT